MSILHSIILGIIEGFTEFLPISSTAHLVLVSHILKIAQSEYTKTFEIAIQSGAILSVLILYWRKFLDLEILKKIIVAFIPTGIIGFIFYKIIKTYFIGNISVILYSLAIGGAILIIFEYIFKKENTTSDLKSISYRQALGVGLFQSVAVIPGVSRSAATIVGGMILGIKREIIVEFSFLLAVPTMLAATGLDLIKTAGEFSLSEATTLGVGFIVSCLTAIISIKFLLRFIKTRTFVSFGIYRIILVIFFTLFLF